MTYRVPDSLEPIEAFRSWGIDDGKLVSLTNGEEWLPGAPIAARCINGFGAGYRWVFVRGGVSREDANARARSEIDVGGFGRYNWGEPSIPNPPLIEPPDGYGFSLEQISHDAPDENCNCGIYAVAAKDLVPGSGQVYGKVKLWGKIIPGENGYRAEYAYPSEFWVAPEMEPEDCLLAFGVDIIIKDDLPLAGSKRVSVTFNGMGHLSSHAISYELDPAPSGMNRVRRIMWGAIALNLACAAVNLLKGFHVF